MEKVYCGDLKVKDGFLGTMSKMPHVTFSDFLTKMGHLQFWWTLVVLYLSSFWNRAYCFEAIKQSR